MPVPVTPNIYSLVNPHATAHNGAVSTYDNHDAIGQQGLERHWHDRVGAAAAVLGVGVAAVIESVGRGLVIGESELELAAWSPASALVMSNSEHGAVSVGGAN